MTNYRVQVKLPAASLLPKDTVTNTFYFTSLNSSVAAEVTEIHNRLIAAYAAIDQDLSIHLSRAANAVSCVFYDMAQPEPRIPIDVKTITLAAAGNAQGMPAEIAVCLSFNSTLASGANLQRRRGRVYLGPWGANYAFVRPPAALQVNINAFSVALETQINGAVPVNWMLYSPTDNAFRTIINSWSDNEWDVQRRRGTTPTSRVTNVVTPNF